MARTHKPVPTTNLAPESDAAAYRTPIVEDVEHPVHRRLENDDYSRNNTSYFRRIPRIRRASGIPENAASDHPSSEELIECEPPKKLTWKQRVKHVTWAYFTLTMATGGMANVLHTGTYGGCSATTLD